MKVMVNGQELEFVLEAAEEAINDLNEYKWNGLEAQIKAGIQNDQETYFEMMRKRLLNPKGKLAFNSGHGKSAGNCCDNPAKYKNIISNNMKFYSCKNCGADLGNIDD